jgi:platelet-activating factor acetylhydrolase
MTDESILQTEILEELPTDHRPDDQWIAARLRVEHEFRKRVFAGVQRKFRRNFQGGMGTGYSTSDEVWSHFKPTEEQLEKWIYEEGRGEARIDEQAALKGERGDTAHKTVESSGPDSDSSRDSAMSDADEEQRRDDSEGSSASRSDGNNTSDSSRTLQNKHTEGDEHTNISAATARKESYDAPPDTWLGMLPALKDGPQQDKEA